MAQTFQKRLIPVLIYLKGFFGRVRAIKSDEKHPIRLQQWFLANTSGTAVKRNYMVSKDLVPKPFGAEQGGLGTGKILCLNPLGLSKVV